MSHEAIGVATINGNVTTIRKYDNGMYGVEVNGDVVYSGESLDEVIKKLDADKIKYKIT
jgi:hypothetical protein